MFWAHGDSGNAPVLFAIDEQARTLARFTVEGASHEDWEDITLDERGHLYIGDIGNNQSERDDLAIHIVREPSLKAGETRIKPLRTIRFRYPDQYLENGERREERNFDAEAMFVLDGQLYIATKHLADTNTTLYRVPLEPSEGEVTLVKIADFDLRVRKKQKNGLVTAAATSPDGRQVALLTYWDLFLFNVGGDKVLEGPVARADTPRLDGLEALTWDEKGLLVGAESGRLMRVPTPKALEPTGP